MSHRRWPDALVAGSLLVALVGVPSTASLAATAYTWTRLGTGSSWNTAKNWDPEGTPDDGDSTWSRRRG